MGRPHYSSAEKYQKAAEPACEVPTFPTWADQTFDPEAEILSGHMMVYEAFLDKDGRPPLPDDADAISDVSEEESSAATDDDEYPTLRRVPRVSMVNPPSTESASNDFEDFVRIEAPRSDPPITLPRPSSPLRNSITTGELADAPSQRDDEEHLFNYYQNYTGGDRTHYPARILPPLETRVSPARRVPGHPRFLPRGEGHRAPLANNPPVVEHLRPLARPRSASVSDARTSVPERWHSAVDGTIISSRLLAQR